MFKLEYDLMEDNRYYIYQHTDDKIDPIAIFYNISLARRFLDMMNKEEKKNAAK